MSRRWIDFAYWAIVVMTFAAISGLGILATRALHEQASETAEKTLAEALSRVKLQGKAFFEDLPQNLRAEPALEFPARSSPLTPLPIPDSTESLHFFLSMTRPVLLEALMNAEIDHKPFWYLLLVKNAFQSGDLEAVHRYCARIRDWPQEYSSIMGLSMKAHATFYEAEAFLLEGKPEAAVSMIQLIAEYPAPKPEFVQDVKISSAWTRIKSEPLFHILLRAWETRETDLSLASPLPEQAASGSVTPHLHGTVASVSGTPTLPRPAGSASGTPTLSEPAGSALGARFLFSGNQVIFVMGKGPKKRFFNGRPFLVQLEEYLQNSAGAGMKISLETLSGPETQQISSVEGIFFSLTTGGKAPGVSHSNRLLVGFLISLGLFGLATMALFNLKRRQESLVQEEKEWLFRQAAHDLKTPLTTIRALAETLSLGRIQSAEQGPRYLEKILHECDYSAELIDSLLLAARLRTGAVNIEPEEIHLLSEVKSLSERFSPRMEGWKISHDIPPGMTLFADPRLFPRVVLNLIENVVRHAGEGKTLEVDCKISSDGMCELGLGDRGKGFSLQSAGLDGDETSGTPLRGASPGGWTHTRSAGGLGLSLIRRIMDLHGGALKIEPRTGGGTIVTTSWKLVQKG